MSQLETRGHGPSKQKTVDGFPGEYSRKTHFCVGTIETRPPICIHHSFKIFKSDEHSGSQRHNNAFKFYATANGLPTDTSMQCVHSLINNSLYICKKSLWIAGSTIIISLKMLSDLIYWSDHEDVTTWIFLLDCRPFWVESTDDGRIPHRNGRLLGPLCFFVVSRNKPLKKTFSYPWLSMSLCSCDITLFIWHQMGQYPLGQQSL